MSENTKTHKQDNAMQMSETDASRDTVTCRSRPTLVILNFLHSTHTYMKVNVEMVMQLSSARN
jgi:hypothetical protein